MLVLGLSVNVLELGARVTVKIRGGHDRRLRYETGILGVRDSREFPVALIGLYTAKHRQKKIIIFSYTPVPVLPAARVTDATLLAIVTVDDVSSPAVGN